MSWYDSVRLPCEIQHVIQRDVGNSLLPDVSIDPSLRKYSYPDSDVVLQQYFKEKLADANTLNKLPGFVSTLGSALGPFTKIPNAVGLGAFLLSFFLEFSMPGETPQDTGEMLRRVFHDEKSDAIRVTMDQYMKQAAVHVGHPAAWHLEEARTTAGVLSKELTHLRHVMMSGRMSSRYLKQWANGAAFHVLLQAHAANIEHTACGTHCSRDARSAAHNLVGFYLARLPALLDEYKRHKISTTRLVLRSKVKYWPNYCALEDTEMQKKVTFSCAEVMQKRHTSRRSRYRVCPITSDDVTAYRNEYVERVLSAPVSELTTYFNDLRSNLNGLMTRPGEFSASCTEVRKTYRYVQCG